MRADIPSITILGVRVARLDAPAAIGEVQRLFDRPGPAVVVYVNAHSLNVASRDDRYRRALDDAALVLNDGAGVALAARIAGQPLPANLNGTDFTPEILRVAAARRAPVFLLGGELGVAETAAAQLVDSIPGLRIVGTHHGFSAEPGEIVARVRSSGAEMLVIALGNPAQELWLHDHMIATGVHVGVAVGAFLDFAAGKVARSPRWMRRARIEWVFRLAQEPRRLVGRYAVGNPLFVLRILAERFGRPRP